MITITNGNDIEYSKGDSFFLPIEAVGDVFDENSKIRLIIAKDDSSAAIVDNTYTYADSIFAVSLTDADKEKLTIGDYIYKLITTTADGTVTTEISGNFIVKWGA